jgi:hypothetical protein
LVSIPKKVGRRKSFDGQRKSGEEGSTVADTAPQPIEPATGKIPVNPLLSKLVFIDWRKSNVMLNREALDAISSLVRDCHPMVLEFLLDKIADRIMADFSLWSLRQKAKDFKDIGDYIYG